MREPQRQHDPVGADPAPASGEVPEQHVQPVIDAGLVNDRHVHDQATRASDRSFEQAPAEFRVAAELTGEAPVEDREPDRLEHRPPGLQRQRLGVLALPWAHDVALAKQLDGEPAVDRDAAEHHPLEDQKPDAIGAQCGVGAPRSRRETHLRRDAVLDRLLAPVRRHGLGEV